MRKLTDVIDLQTLKDKYLSGMSLVDISCELKISVTTVHKYLKPLGIMRNRSESANLAVSKGKNGQSFLYRLSGFKCCKDCLVEKPLSEFYATSQGHWESYCKICHGSRSDIWRTKNKLHVNQMQRDKYDPIKAAIKAKNYRLKTGELGHQHRLRKTRDWKNKQSSDLGDFYIKFLLASGTRVKSNLIPIELVQAKRVQLQIKRYLKEQA